MVWTVPALAVGKRLIVISPSGQQTIDLKAGGISKSVVSEQILDILTVHLLSVAAC